jgi:hypothetical protein
LDTTKKELILWQKHKMASVTDNFLHELRVLMLKINSDCARLVFDLKFLQDSQTSERCAAKGEGGNDTTSDA